jgi:hypothetical protein
VFVKKRANSSIWGVQNGKFSEMAKHGSAVTGFFVLSFFLYVSEIEIGLDWNGFQIEKKREEKLGKK